MENYYISQAQQSQQIPTQPTNVWTASPMVWTVLVTAVISAVIGGIAGAVANNYFTKKQKQATKLSEKLENNERFEMSIEYEKALLATERKLVELNLTQVEIKNKMLDLATKKQVEENHTAVMAAFEAMNERLNTWIKAN